MAVGVACWELARSRKSLKASSNSIRYIPVSNPKKALSSRALDGAVRCCPSTQGSWHRQSGPDSCMPITSASATSARATIAPDYLLRQHVRIGRRRSLDCVANSSCSVHNHNETNRSCTRGYALSAQIYCFHYGYGHCKRSSRHKS